MPDWPELSTRFELVIHFGDDVRPTGADLDAFEARFDLRLPDDYRRFAQALGAGEIGGISSSCNMFAPGGPPGLHLKADLSLFNVGGPSSLSVRDALRAMIAQGDIQAEPDWVERLVFFFIAGEGEDHFAWQPREVTDPDTHDMAIYHVQLDSDKIVRVAATFRQFVMDYLLAGRYFRENFGGAVPAYYNDPGHVFEYYQYAYTIPE